jgi:hypothetical protein
MAHCQPPRCAWPGAHMNAGSIRHQHHLHEINKVRLRIPACLDEINETSFARLELGF